MTEELITVVTVNYNTADFIAMNLYGLSKLTKMRYKMIICDNGSRYLDKRNLKRIESNYSNVEVLFRKQTAPAGIGHGEALNLLIDKINTPYGVILDSDAIFLKKEWDDILITQLDDRIKIIGCPPVKNPIKPTDFPSVYATLFETETFKSLHIDMRPKNYKKGLDTGWEMRVKFLKNCYNCKLLEARNTREFKEGPFRNIICTEYYLAGDNDIFACHFGRGSSSGVWKYKKMNKVLSLPIVGYFAKRVRGNREKAGWLAICKEIIDREDEV